MTRQCAMHCSSDLLPLAACLDKLFCVPLLQVPVGEGGTTAWKTCVLTPSSTVTLYLDVSAPHAVSVLVA